MKSRSIFYDVAIAQADYDDINSRIRYYTKHFYGNANIFASRLRGRTKLPRSGASMVKTNDDSSWFLKILLRYHLKFDRDKHSKMDWEFF